MRVATAHGAKGLEADHVYLFNPELFPLKERILLGGWQRYEELCVAFVAVTRAKNRLVYLPNLAVTSRASCLDLFLQSAPPTEQASQQSTWRMAITRVPTVYTPHLPTGRYPDSRWCRHYRP